MPGARERPRRPLRRAGRGAAFNDDGAWLDALVAHLDAAHTARRAAGRRTAGGLLCPRRRVTSRGSTAARSASATIRAVAFLERGRVASSPGPSFGKEGNGFARLNFATSGDCLPRQFGGWPRRCSHRLPSVGMEKPGRGSDRRRASRSRAWRRVDRSVARLDRSAPTQRAWDASARDVSRSRDEAVRAACRRRPGFCALSLQRARSPPRQLRACGRVRELADSDRIQRFMKTFGLAAPRAGTCYLTGGSSAVLYGWRATTVDVDIALEPEQDELLRSDSPNQR